jgi:addiction module HigA family antidote
MSGYRLAKETGLSPIRVSHLLRGQRPVTAATALRLARFFGQSARFWLNLQAAHDLEVAEQKLAHELARIRPQAMPHLQEHQAARSLDEQDPRAA